MNDGINDSEINAFEANRGLMFSIAYRMLGSATEAEDIVQEAYLRYQSALPQKIESPRAFLTTVVTRLCLNHLQLAQVQRETYVGPWLPEPVLTEADERLAPPNQVELHESLSIAFLALLEQLTPLERAVFLLREVFEYEYVEIGEIVGREEAACRQMFSRARKHIAEHRPRFKPSPQAHRQILEEFLQAVGTGELDGLVHLLSEEVTLWTDGGGKTRGAALHPLHGRNAVAQFLLASLRLAPPDTYSDQVEVNGEPAVIVRTDSQVVIVFSVVLDEGKIREIRVMGNPDKLKWVSGNRKDEEIE